MKSTFEQQVQSHYLTLQSGQRNVAVGVYITSVKTIRTKKGDAMAFLSVSDA